MRILAILLLISCLGLFSCNEDITPPRSESEFMTAIIDSGSTLSIRDSVNTFVDIMVKNNQKFTGVNAVLIEPIYLRDTTDRVLDNCFALYEYGDFLCSAFTPKYTGYYTLQTKQIIHRPDKAGDLFTVISKITDKSMSDVDTLGLTENCLKTVKLYADYKYNVRAVFIPMK